MVVITTCLILVFSLIALGSYLLLKYSENFDASYDDSYIDALHEQIESEND